MRASWSDEKWFEVVNINEKYMMYGHVHGIVKIEDTKYFVTIVIWRKTPRVALAGRPGQVPET